MKLTKQQIRRLIKEELQTVLRSRPRLDERVGTEEILMQHVEDQLAPIKTNMKLLGRAVKALIKMVNHLAKKQGKAPPLARALKDVPWMEE